MDKGIWEKIQPILQQRLGQQDYNSWLKDIVFEEISQEGCLVISAKNSFIREWVETHYSHVILESLKTLESDIKFVVVKENNLIKSEPSVSETGVQDEEGKKQCFDDSKSFKNFVVGKSNEFAYAAALRVAESPKILYNPLFLYGGVGLGKTHLMNATALKIKELYPHKQVLYISAEQFMYRFIKALRFKDTVSFKEEFRNIDVLMIDDVQFFSTRTTTQEEFFHTFNALIDDKKQIILSADKSPTDLENIEERLKSRMSWGLIADIHPTTYELRFGILASKAELMGLKISERVLEFLASKLSSCNIRELEGALNRINAHVSLVGREIDVDSCRDILKNLLKTHDRVSTIDEIKKKVCEYFGVKTKEMDSPKRLKNITRARQIAMYLCKELTEKSLPEIGREFGGKDHTTVLYSIDKVKELMKEDQAYTEDIHTLKSSLMARGG